jgi:hypothetical protein
MKEIEDSQIHTPTPQKQKDLPHSGLEELICTWLLRQFIDAKQSPWKYQCLSSQNQKESLHFYRRTKTMNRQSWGHHNTD